MATKDAVPVIEAPDAEKQGVTMAMDEAAQYLTHNAGVDPLSPEEERKMIRKMDWILLPMVGAMITECSPRLTAVSSCSLQRLWVPWTRLPLVPPPSMA
jgi:hypothetical protein